MRRVQDLDLKKKYQLGIANEPAMQPWGPLVMKLPVGKAPSPNKSLQRSGRHEVLGGRSTVIFLRALARQRASAAAGEQGRRLCWRGEHP